MGGEDLVVEVVRLCCVVAKEIDSRELQLQVHAQLFD